MFACTGRPGFTLLELLAVLAVIAALTAIVIGVGRRAAESGQVARARAELVALAAALEAFKTVHGDYPRTDDAAQLLQALLGRRDATLASANGRAVLEVGRFKVSADPYASETARLLDPWDQPYRYAYRSMPGWTNPGFVLTSAGPDRADTPVLRTGGFPDDTAPGNADNLHATSVR